MKIVTKIITDCIEDILIIAGLAIIIAATFIINRIAGLYCLGVALLLLGAFFAKFPFKRGEKK